MGEKTYVIVGGSSGIGLEMTCRLSAEGHRVVVASRTADKLEGLAGVTHIPLDVTTDTLPTDALPQKLDGMVYCPGSIRLRPFRTLQPEDFLADYQVNFLGAVRSLQACLPALKKADGGASIVLFSTVAVQTGMPFHTSIASAKGALEGLTRSLAAELAPNIRVNAVAPSLTDTPLAEALLGSDEKRRAADDRHPLKRIGQPGDIAAAALYLLGKAGAWVTGQILHVDGGMGALRTFK
jgi:NAD(P)-dependent dehydrogenase (short-subunit alcohol dehydrogenase family)